MEGEESWNKVYNTKILTLNEPSLYTKKKCIGIFTDHVLSIFLVYFLQTTYILTYLPKEYKKTSNYK